ncbi:MAG: PRC-barrel domain-containing protein [Nitrososphaerota archaeon]
MGKRFFKRDEIVGKDVISDNAVRLGKIKDIGYDQEGKIVLIYEKVGEGGEDAIPSSQILAFGDVVLVKSDVQEKIHQKAMSSTKICPKCGRTNPPDYLYCAGCGSRLEGS